MTECVMKKYNRICKSALIQPYGTLSLDFSAFTVSCDLKGLEREFRNAHES